MPLGGSISRSGLGAFGSLGIHGALAVLLSYLSVPPPPPEEPQIDLIEFELPPEEPEPEPEKEPEPEPEPEAEKPPEQEPEPVPEVRKDEPPPKPRPRPRPRPAAESESDEPPPPLRVDVSQTTQSGTSGVKIGVGTPGGVPGGTGAPESKGQGGKAPGTEQGTGTGPPWEPRGELYIRELPAVIHVPQEQCPAVQELGIEGVVILTVQVRRDGSVKDVKIARDIGHGCGKVAARALRKAKFRPAIATNGQPADFELRYEYEFQLGD
ncbi:MAG TPA: energy transducer TonB [Nannocystis sp.]